MDFPTDKEMIKRMDEKKHELEMALVEILGIAKSETSANNQLDIISVAEKALGIKPKEPK